MTTTENKIRVAPRIEPESADFYQAHFKNLNAGSQWALETMPKLASSKIVNDLRNGSTGSSTEKSLGWVGEALPILVQRTLAFEIRGVFTKNELAFILNTLKPQQIMTTPQLTGQHLIMSVKTAFDLQPTAEKTAGVSKVNLLEKLNDLTVFQAASLEYWAAMARDDETQHLKLLL